MCEATGFTAADIVNTLLEANMLRYQSGKHVLLMDDAALNRFVEKQKQYDVEVRNTSHIIATYIRIINSQLSALYIAF